jgi:hypothetical protein
MLTYSSALTTQRTECNDGKTNALGSPQQEVYIEVWDRSSMFYRDLCEALHEVVHVHGDIHAYDSVITSDEY